ncbi:MAG: biotin--[acetyl-CoA-carboxylase] ligase [Gammaproteobacteria bacterium]|nr:MAG: biotin--[acetyl-CoA-carboxylase] ligase [Gammaproteobacteria bacterium]
MSEQNTRERILELLIGGEWVSGQHLADSLGCSRTAVWKHVQALREQGIRIEQVRGRGYRLQAGQDLLNPATLRTVVTGDGAHDTVLAYQTTCDSTNTLARQILVQGVAPRVVVTAERQLAGRGRLGRDWVSPMAAHLYMSVGFRWAQGYETLGGLSLAAGTCVAEALQEYSGAPLTLKWPNDIHAERAKLCGILVELEGEQGGEVRVVLGVGVNVHEDGQMGCIDQPWITLDRLAGRALSRTEVFEAVWSRLSAGLELFRSQGWPAFMERWTALDRYQGAAVEIRDINGGVMAAGEYRGVDSAGCLCLGTPDGIRKIHSGELSLRVQP